MLSAFLRLDCQQQIQNNIDYAMEGVVYDYPKVKN